MKRIRATGWAIGLWLVLVVIFAIDSLGSESSFCHAVPSLGSTCGQLYELGIAVAYSVLFIVGVIVLLLTRPDGAVRAFLVRIMVNTLALVATLAVLSFIRLPTGVPGESEQLLRVPSGWLIIGTLFAIVNVVVRPVLFALFGRWILRTAGVAVVLVNAGLFWLVSEISGWLGAPWLTPDPRWLWLFIDSIVFTVFLTVVDAFLGLDRPRLEPSTSRSLWRLLDRLPARRRSALIESIRLQEVYDTLSSYGLEIAVGGSVLAPIRRLGDRMMGRAPSDLDSLSTPAKIRVMLQQLGPTYVKIGQMASSRADALPDEWREELDKLQSTVPPFPWEVARQIIVAELGAEPEELFGSIDQEPFGAASLAQVHRATLKDGRQVVVKIQRPDVQAKVRADLGVLIELAGVAEARLAAVRQLDAVGLAREFADGVLEELDYRTEAYHAHRLASVVAGIDGVHVPEIHDALSTSRVLVMEFVPGVKATRGDRLDPSIDREAVARTFIRAMIKQVMVDGFFHADPHPGNIMLDPQTGRLTFLDLGLIGELRQEQRLDLLALLWALQMGDPNALASVALRLCRATGPVDEGAFRASVERLYYQYWLYGNASFSRMMSAMFATLRQQNLRMRSELTLAVKAMTQAEELMRSISPGMKLVQASTQEAEQLLRDQLTPERVAKLVRGQLTTAVQQALASASDGGVTFGPLLLDVITGGRLGSMTPTAPPVDLEPLMQRVDGLGERLDRSVRWFGVLIGGIGIAVALALALLAAVFWDGADPSPAEAIAAVALVITVGWLGLTVLRARGPGAAGS